MTVPARSVAPAWRFALAALGLSLAAWLWFIVCFTARVAAWWNSVWLFAALYLVAFLLALRSIHFMARDHRAVCLRFVSWFCEFFILG